MTSVSERRGGPARYCEALTSLQGLFRVCKIRHSPPIPEHSMFSTLLMLRKISFRHILKRNPIFPGRFDFHSQ